MYCLTPAVTRTTVRILCLLSLLVHPASLFVGVTVLLERIWPQAGGDKVVGRRYEIISGERILTFVR